MKIPFFRHFNPVTQLFGAFTLFFTGLLLTNLIIKVLFMIIWRDAATDTIDADTIVNLSRINAFLGALLAFTGASTIFRKLMEFEGQDYLRIRKGPSLKSVGLILVLFFPCFFIANFLFYVNTQLDLSAVWPSIGQSINEAEKTSQEISLTLYVEPDVWKYVLSMLSVGLITAIGEEFFFRGIVQRLFIKMLRNVHVAILVSTLIFALVHGSYYGMLPRIFLGLILGYMYVCTGNIWHSILFHFFNNGAIITFYWLSSRGFNVEPVSEFGFTGNGRWVALGLLLVITVFTYTQLRKYIRQEVVREMQDY